MWSITMDLVSKPKTTHTLAKVSTPSMRSNIGSPALLLRSIMSGVILKYLDVEYVRNPTSKIPAFVVLKVPFEVFQLNGVRTSYYLVCYVNLSL